MKRIILLSLIFSIFLGCSLPSTNIPTTVEYEISSIITISNAASPAEYRFDFGPNMTILDIPLGSTGITFQSDIVKLTTLPNPSYPFTLYLNGEIGSIGCTDIVIETFVDGQLQNTQNLQMGYTSINPEVYCDNTLGDHIFNTTIYLDLD